VRDRVAFLILLASCSGHRARTDAHDAAVSAPAAAAAPDDVIGHGSGTGSSRPIDHARSAAEEAAAPRVRLGVGSATGSTPVEVVRRFLRREAPRLQACYAGRLAAVPGLAGEATSRFTIAAGGEVSTAAVEGLDPDLGRCMADVIRAIRFPPPRDGGAVTVTQSFELTPPR